LNHRRGRVVRAKFRVQLVELFENAERLGEFFVPKRRASALIQVVLPRGGEGLQVWIFAEEVNVIVVSLIELARGCQLLGFVQHQIFEEADFFDVLPEDVVILGVVEQLDAEFFTGLGFGGDFTAGKRNGTNLEHGVFIGRIEGDPVVRLFFEETLRLRGGRG
jgi:hypothetical protein